MEFLRLHFIRGAEFLTKLSQRFSEVRLTVSEHPKHLPEKKVEVLEAIFRTIKDHYSLPT